MSDVRFRSIRASDLEALFRLDQLCFEPGIAYSREELRRFLELPTAESVLAEKQGRLAAFALGSLKGSGVGQVITLDVAPDSRRCGVGRALLGELLALLARAGARDARLEVDERNSGAIAFYRRLGFRTRRRLPDYYAPGLPALEMEAPLSVASA